MMRKQTALPCSNEKAEAPLLVIGSGGKGRKSRVRLGRAKAEMIRKSLEFSNLISVKTVLVLPDYFSPVSCHLFLISSASVRSLLFCPYHATSPGFIPLAAFS